jgi:molecular chaperone IbpA
MYTYVKTENPWKDTFDNLEKDFYTGFTKFQTLEKPSSYPPYNIMKTDSGMVLEIALAGFSKDQIDVSAEKEVLTINSINNDRDKGPIYKYKGISNKDYELKFRISRNTEITAVTFINGLLIVDMFENTPEAEKPRHYKIK